MATKYTEEVKQAIVKRYLSGETVNALSTEFGIARSTIYYWIKLYNSNPKEKKITLREFSNALRSAERMRRIVTILQDSPCTATAPLKDRFAVIEAFSSKYNVNTLCEALRVAKGSYYNHIFRNKRENSQNNQYRKALKPIIQEIYDNSNQIFGAGKIASVLKERGYRTTERSVHSIMLDMGLQSIRTDSKQIHKNELKKKRQNILNQNFKADAPNKVWISDVTQFSVKGFKFYICVIIDIFSRKVVSYHISKNNSTHLAKITFKKGYDARNPEGELLFHTDNGSNYISNTFMKYLRELGVEQSFSRAHVPYDNSVCESFFSSMKREELYRYKYPTVAEFKRSVEKYISFYNSERPHATLRYKTPDTYERDYWLKQGLYKE